MSFKLLQLISVLFLQMIVSCAPQAPLTGKSPHQDGAGQRFNDLQSLTVQVRHTQNNGTKTWTTGIALPVSSTKNNCTFIMNRDMLLGAESVQVIIGNKRFPATILKDDPVLHTALLSLSINDDCMALSKKLQNSVNSYLKQQSSFIPGTTSYFLTASIFGEKNKMHLARGMAVAVASAKDRCILLTNKHLVANFDSFMASPWTDTPHSSPVQLFGKKLYIDNQIDAALVSITSPGGCAVVNKANANPDLTSQLTVLGQVKPYNGFVSQGIVSGYWPTTNGQLMVSDVLTTLGYSGSGVFDKNNNLIGLVTGKTQDIKKGFAYIIPVSKLSKVLEYAKQTNGSLTQIE